MPKREESTLGPSLMDNKAGPVIRSFKGYVLNMEAAMKTNSKQDDLHAQNTHNFINQKIISDVRLRLFNTVKNWVNKLVLWAITTVMLLRFDSATFLTLKTVSS